MVTETPVEPLIPLIESIDIKNFRGIRSCRIEQFATVNVLVGRNNSAKSCILEAIYAFQPLISNSPSQLKRLFARRAARPNWIVRQLFFQYTSSFSPEVRLRLTNGEVFQFRIETDFNFTLINVILETDKGDRKYTLTREFGEQSPSGVVPESLATLEAIKALRDIKLFDSTLAYGYSELEPTILKATLADTEEFSRMYGPAASGVFLDYLGDKRMAFQYGDLHIFADDVGDGQRHSHIILSLARRLKKTILLIEEIETHQHPAALEKMITMLVDMAQTNRLQLIVTTHSPDVYRIFTRIPEVKFFHIQRAKNGSVTAVPVRGEDLSMLYDIGFDPSFALRFERFVLVEGIEDREILRYAIWKHRGRWPEELGVTIVPARGKDRNLRELMKNICLVGREVFVLKDLNGDTPDKVRISLIDSFKSLTKEGFELVTDDEQKVVLEHKTRQKIELRKSNLIPLGNTTAFPDIEKHSIEDYLIELLTKNPQEYHDLLRDEISPNNVNGPTSKQVLERLLRTTDINTLVEIIERAKRLPDSLVSIVNIISPDVGSDLGGFRDEIKRPPKAVAEQ